MYVQIRQNKVQKLNLVNSGRALYDLIKPYCGENYL